MNQKGKNNILFLIVVTIEKYIFFSVLIIALSFSFLLFKNSVRGDDISDLQKKIDSQEEQKTELEQQLAQIKQNVNATQADIARTTALISQVEDSISSKETEIDSLNSKIDFQKEALESLVQEAYYAKQEPLVDVVLNENNFSEAWGKIDDVINFDQKITDVINDISQSKDAIESDRQNLLQSKSDREQLLTIKSAQQRSLLQNQADTQVAIQDKATTIAQLQGELDALRSEYSAALGKNISTDDIVAAAKFAAKATGMNKSFLLGVLVQESNKGQNVGGCNYKTSRMPSSQLTAFKSICKELNYDYTKQKVSCPSGAYKGTGGAMGVPQFMPTTWEGYESSIASLSGHNPPDPWNLVDGVVAMADKLSNDGADSKTRFAEAKSYCIYLAGANWGSYCYGSASKYKDDYSDIDCSGSSIHNYGEKVLCLMDNYDKYY